MKREPFHKNYIIRMLLRRNESDCETKKARKKISQKEWFLLKKSVWSLTLALLFPFAYIALQWVFSTSVKAAGLPETNNMGLAVIFLAGALVLLGATQLLRKSNLGLSRPTLTLPTAGHAVPALFCVLGGIGLNLLARTTLRPIFGVTFGDAQTMTGFPTNASLFVVLLVFCVCIPLIEELLFRGLSYKALRNELPVWVSVGGSALFFGAAHMGLGQGAYAAVLGVVLALSYEWTGYLWAPVILHISYKSVGNLVSDLLVGKDTPVILLVVFGLVGAALAGWCLLRLYWTKEEARLHEKLNRKQG